MPPVRRRHQLRRCFWFRGRRPGHIKGLGLLSGCAKLFIILAILLVKVFSVAVVFIHILDVVVSLVVGPFFFEDGCCLCRPALPCGLGACLDKLDQVLNILRSALENILPYELVGIAGRARVAAAAADKGLPSILRVLVDAATGKLLLEHLWRHDIRAAVDGSQGVDIPGR